MSAENGAIGLGREWLFVFQKSEVAHLVQIEQHRSRVVALDWAAFENRRMRRNMDYIAEQIIEPQIAVEIAQVLRRIQIVYGFGVRERKIAHPHAVLSERRSLPQFIIVAGPVVYILGIGPALYGIQQPRQLPAQVRSESELAQQSSHEVVEMVILAVSSLMVVIHGCNTIFCWFPI